MLQIYKRFWQVNWAEQWQYRANLLMYLAYWMVSPIIYLSVWSAIANAQGSVGGLTAGDFAAYYLTVLPVDILTASITIHILGYKIQDGTIANELLRPAHPVLTNTLINSIAFKALQMFIFVPIWLLLVLIFQPNLTITATSLLTAAPAIVLGFLINFLFDGCITLIAFWTTRVWAVQQMNWAVMQLFNGAFVPISLLPSALQGIARVLPYQLWLSFPVMLLLNKLDAATIATNYALQGLWLLIFFGAFKLMWSRAVKRFSAVGA